MLRLLFLHIQVPTTSSPGDGVPGSRSHPTRHYFQRCYAWLTAAAIDEVAPARCKTLKQTWCFTRLPATLWESRSSPLFLRELQLLRLSFFCCMPLIPLVYSGPMVLRPCFVRPIAAGINELALLTLTIPACRAPRGVTLPHFAWLSAAGIVEPVNSLVGE